MVDDKDKPLGSKNLSDQDHLKSKRPTATLELKAEDVTSEAKEGDFAKSTNISNEDEIDLQKENETETAKDTKFKSQDIPVVSSHIFSGLIGGFIAFGSILGAQYLGLVSNNASNQVFEPQFVEELTSKMDRIEQRAEKTIQQSAEKAVQGYADRLNQIDKKVSVIAGSAKSKDGSRVAEAAAITNLLSELETNFEKKLSSLRSQLETQISESITQSQADFKKSLKRTPIISGKENSNIMRQLLSDSTSDITKNIDDLQTKIALLSQGLEKLEGAYSQSQTGFESSKANVDRIDQRIQDVAGEIDVLRNQAFNQSKIEGTLRPIAKRIASVEGKLKSILEKSEQYDDGLKNTALSIAFTGLRRTVNRGEPFGEELEVVRKLTKAPVKLDGLDRFQTQGVPSLQVLEKKFPELLQNILKADARTEATSMWDKFSQNALSMVKFRRVGNIAGNDTEAILARMEFQLKKRNYAKVIEESLGLKGKAAEVAEKWVMQLDARLKLDEALQKIEMMLLSQFGSSESSVSSGKIQ